MMIEESIETSPKAAKEWRDQKIKELEDKLLIYDLDADEKKKIQDEIDRLKKVNKENCPNLEDVYEVYRKWLHIEDTKRIDIVFAVYLSQFLQGTPIWLFLVGPSGDWKTEQVMALKNCVNFKVLHNLTSRTLVSGNPKVNDLAPELDNCLVVIPDMAQILELPPQEKAEIWGQFRDLYDGFAGKNSGSGKRKNYDGLRVTMLGCSTPIIDSQILIHQSLGTRELIYRTEKVNGLNKLMDMAMDNENWEKCMRLELSQITSSFFYLKKITKKDISEEEMEKLKEIALLIPILRACGEYDNFTNELKTDVSPEMPTRILKQLKRIYMCLMSLDENYSSNKAFDVLWRIAESCASPIRLKVLRFFIQNSGQFSTSHIANKLLIGKSSAKRELCFLWNLRILIKEEREEGNRWQPTDYWCIDPNTKIINLKLLSNYFNNIQEEKI